MTLFGNKLLIIFLTIILCICSVNSYSIENKIKFRINEEIITSIDIYNEINYLKIFSPKIKELSNDQILKVAQNSLINETIKNLEISKYLDQLNENKSYQNQLIETTYKKMGIKSYENFLDFLDQNNLSISFIKKKISTELFWKQFIFAKFSNKIKIDEEDLKKKISNNLEKKRKLYYLSEILFEVKDNNDQKTKIKEIENSIIEKGFQNTALIYSIADTSKDGGRLGWISENSLNKNIKKNLRNLKIGEITKPIISGSNFLILKIDDVKLDEKKIDMNKELKKIVDAEKNKQLNQLANIYFNKIRKDYNINEL